MSDACSAEVRIADGLLLRRYREQGDEVAFTHLRRRHERLVFSAALRETGDRSLAEDATQGAFLLLMRKGFPDDASLAGWLFGAVRLVSMNLVREESRRRIRERRAYQEPETPDEAWVTVEPHLNDALAALKAGDREAVLLRFADERSLAEVGRFLGVGENAARMRVARALERMRVHLRRAGVGVSVVLLASLLSIRLADATPSASTPIGFAPSARAVRFARRTFWTPGTGALWSPSVVLPSAFLVLALGGAIYRKATELPALSPIDAVRLLARCEGAWKGSLEFADDRTQVRTSTATMVAVAREGDGLRLAARFPDYANLDTTTIRPLGEGRFAIDARGSHRLDGEYRLVRLQDGTPAFLGFSPTVRGEVRFRFLVTADRLTIQEEFERDGTWRFRNRYELSRTP